MKKTDSKLVEIKRNGKYGFADETGKEVIPCEYDDVSLFHEGLCGVKKGPLWGFINESGENVISFRYGDVDGFYDGVWRVQSLSVMGDPRWGLIDKSGNELIGTVFEKIGIFHEGFAYIATSNYKYGYIDKTGKYVIPFEFDYARDFCDGLAAVKKSNKWGYIDKTGKHVIPFEFDDARNFYNGLAAVKKSNKWGYIDKTGKIIIPFAYEEVCVFGDNGLAVVKKSGKWGYIDKTGKIIIPFAYEEVRVFGDNGLAAVNKSGKWGFINTLGIEVIPCNLDYGPCGAFKDGLCFVSDNKDNYGYINEYGNMVVTVDGYHGFPYDEHVDNGYECVNNAYVLKKKEDKWGLLFHGIELVPYKYNSPQHLIASIVNGGNTDVTQSEDVISYFSHKKDSLIIDWHEEFVVGKNKNLLFQTDSAKCYLSLSSDKDSLLEELTLKNYGKQKEEVVTDGTISFKCADGSSLSVDYKGGFVTYLPSLEKWVSTAHIAVSDDDLTKILQEGITVTTQQGETLPVNAAYEDYLCLKYLVCPTACTDEQKAYLQNLVDKENQEAERKAAELEAKRQEEERIAAEERAKAEAIAAAERAANEREQQKQNSGCASVIVIIIIFSLFITLI